MASSSDSKKIIILVVLLVAVAVVFAWQFGLFGGGNTVQTPTIDPNAPAKGGPRTIGPGGK
ncbi:MAG: hypothetical protein JNM80_10645 [Phycisphaerae bacterium]|nr:hypothetical protein [Phycisphaerae bacterium]